ncbi:hypothetical protein [Lacticaseibacillus mingshuiensis]|uniref:Uncharacterized protein n=1 Tax=Lacticaseibacillus mingshuiensis TaxID=2799574 RepID=A0ABW4CKZ6_9LACO|nr:hypothetical protein [Lacticaseibacillus mingshuiensis]
MKYPLLSVAIVGLVLTGLPLETQVHASVNEVENVQSLNTTPSVITSIPTEGEDYEVVPISQVPSTTLSYIADGRTLNMSAAPGGAFHGYMYIVLLNKKQAVAFNYGGTADAFYQWPQLLTDHKITRLGRYDGFKGLYA